MIKSVLFKKLKRKAPLALLFCAFPALAQEVIFEFPLQCTLGEDCFLQQLVDHDPSENVSDFKCLKASYDGHKGTDFRLQNMKAIEKGVNVLAAADGVVSAVRDGMEDVLAINPKLLAAVKGKDCGNGLIIQHKEGWVTEYCHLKKGTVRVKHGQKVKTGHVIGQVGASGSTQFPHLHITFRKDDKVVDPFAPDYETGECLLETSKTLWSQRKVNETVKNLTKIFDIGFGNKPVSKSELEEGIFEKYAPSIETPIFIGYVRASNIQADDIVRGELRGDGFLVSTLSKKFEAKKAQILLFTGKRKPNPNWPSGEYVWSVEIIRDGKVVAAKTRGVTLR